jgi:hypothetical protein
MAQPHRPIHTTRPLSRTIKKAALEPLFSFFFFCGRASDLTDVARLQLAVLSRRDIELDARVLIKGLETLDLYLGIVNEQIVPILARDEPVSLVLIEPLHFTFSHVLPFFLPREA